MLVRDERRPAHLEVPTTDLVLRDELGKQRRALLALGTFAQRTLQKGGSALRSASRRKATLIGGEATWPLSRGEMTRHRKAADRGMRGTPSGLVLVPSLAGQA